MEKKRAKSVWEKMGPQAPIERTLPQVKKSNRPQENILRDAARFARQPGKRLSKSGKIYWETRENRSDMKGKNL